MGKMTKVQARRWIREHFAEFIKHSDCQMDCPAEVYEIWGDETQKIAARLRRGATTLEAQGGGE